jgi:hypothetical protein
MKAPDVKPISSVGNFSVDEHGDKGITWNFRLSPDADSDIWVTTGEPAKATIGANDMKDAAILSDRRCSIRKRSAQCRFILKTIGKNPIADAQISHRISCQRNGSGKRPRAEGG